MANQFETQPPSSTCFILSSPAPFVLLITINREAAMNSIPKRGHWEADKIWHWFDEEPNVRVAIVTGKGPKSFCAGMDLIERHQGGTKEADDKPLFPIGGFMGLSRRRGKKPVIAAVNGYALGGGMEIALNCDMIVASPTARFGLPEAKRGLYAGAGGLPRIVHIFGMQLASEVALAGRVLSAREAEQHGFARVSKSPESLLDEAVELANQVASLSPDAVIISRAGLREAWETASVERAVQLTDEQFRGALGKSENYRIGLEAFAKKKQPIWVPSKL